MDAKQKVDVRKNTEQSEHDNLPVGQEFTHCRPSALPGEACPDRTAAHKVTGGDTGQRMSDRAGHSAEYIARLRRATPVDFHVDLYHDDAVHHIYRVGV